MLLGGTSIVPRMVLPLTVNIAYFVILPRESRLTLPDFTFCAQAAKAAGNVRFVLLAFLGFGVAFFFIPLLSDSSFWVESLTTPRQQPR